MAQAWNASLVFQEISQWEFSYPTHQDRQRDRRTHTHESETYRAKASSLLGLVLAALWPWMHMGFSCCSELLEGTLRSYFVHLDRTTLIWLLTNSVFPNNFRRRTFAMIT